MPRIVPVTRTLAALVVAAVAGLSCRDSFPTAPTTVAEVAMSPRAPTLTVGDTMRMSAVALDRNFTGIDGRHAEWSSGAGTIATIDADGLLHALHEGTALVTAEIDGHTDTTTVTVLPTPVDSVSVAPVRDTLLPGRTQQFQVTAFDRHHVVLQGREATWSTDDAAVVTVSASGVVSAVGIGTTTIHVTVEGKSASASVTVIPVPVRQVVVTPTPVQLQQGSTVQLTASTRDSAGTPLAGRAVSWQSLNTAVATVDQNGLVTGVAPGGPVSIVATSEGVTGAAAITVAVPAIGLSATTASFTARWQQGNPAPQTVAVTNAGAFTLSGLSTSIAYGPGATGWLSASLNSTTAPATLTLQPVTGTLLPGTYTATVTVASSQPGVQGRTIAVSFTVTPRPIIALSNTAPQFAAQANGSLPGAQAISITNSGTGSLTGLSFSVSYGPGASGWLDASLSTSSAPSSLTLQPNTTALAVGTYSARVILTSTDPAVAPDTVSVSYVIAQGPIIGLSRTTVGSSRQAFSVAPDTQLVQVTNPGGGTLDGLSASVSFISPQTGWLTASVSPSTAPSTLTLVTNASGLAAGSYAATVTVSSTQPGVQSQSVSVTLTVTPQPIIVFGSNPVGLSATRGGGLPAAQGVSITNGGGGTLSGLSTGTAYGPGASGWLNVSLGSPTAPTTLTLQPNTTVLAAGTYTATVTVSSSVPGVASQALTVNYTVLQPQIALSQTTFNFGSVTRGFTSNNGVTVSNSGQGTLTGLSVSSNAAWLSGSLASGTAPTTLSVSTNTSTLAAGSYTGVLTVASSLPGVASQTVTVNVTVLQPQIGLTATSFLRFVRPASTGATLTSNTVSISNTGSGTLDGLAVSNNVTWLTTSLNSTTAPSTLTIAYNTTGLAVGTYVATVTITSTVPGVLARAITVTLNIDWSFASDISPMLTGASSSCDGCHDVNFNYSTLFPPPSYNGIPTNGIATTGTLCDAPQRIRIVPGDTSASLLYQKLARTVPPCGVQMPQGGPFWSALQLQKLREWIVRGSPNN